MESPPVLMDRADFNVLVKAWACTTSSSKSSACSITHVTILHL